MQAALCTRSCTAAAAGGLSETLIKKTNAHSVLQRQSWISVRYSGPKIGGTPPSLALILSVSGLRTKLSAKHKLPARTDASDGVAEGGQRPLGDAQRQRSAEAVAMRWLSSYMAAWELRK